MKRTIHYTAIVVGISCGIALLAQAARNRSLSAEAQGKATELNDLKAQLDGAHAPDDSLSALTPRQKSIAKYRDSSTSEERIEHTHSQIEALVAELGEIGDSPARLYSELPKLLSLIQELDLDEIIAVADRIDSEFSADFTDGAGAMKLVLIMLATEQDPQRVFERPDVAKNPRISAMVLTAIGREDPDAALAMLDRITPEFEATVWTRITRQALNNDFEKGLQLIREAQKKGREGATRPLQQLQMGQLAPEVTAAAIAAMKRPENEPLRKEIVGAIITNSLHRGGTEAAKAVVERHQMDHEDVGQHLADNYYNIMDSNPTETLTWMLEVQTPAQREAAIPKAIKNWTIKDYNAAGEFLGTMEPSTTKDKAIVEYSNLVINLDPQAATIWAAQIEDPDLRDEAIRLAADSWHDKHPQAALEWIAEQELDPGEVLTGKRMTPSYGIPR